MRTWPSTDHFPRHRGAERSRAWRASTPPARSSSAPSLAGAALGAIAALGGALATRLGAAIAAACRGEAVLAPGALVETVVTVALPILGAAAVAAVLGQLAQTRAAWLPRRRVPGAPVPVAGAAARTRRAAGELVAAAAVGGTAVAWLWSAAPRLASLLAVPGSSLLTGASALVVRLAGALIVAWLAAGVLDAVARHVALDRALAMSSAEKREDDRLSGADPRWRSRRAQLARGPGPRDAVAGAAVVVLGDDAAVAIAWDPAVRPIPTRTATGRGARSTQLVGLARRHRIAVHRDPVLAAALVDGEGPIAAPHWPRLAAIIAATRGRDRTA